MNDTREWNTMEYIRETTTRTREVKPDVKTKEELTRKLFETSFYKSAKGNTINLSTWNIILDSKTGGKSDIVKDNATWNYYDRILNIWVPSNLAKTIISECQSWVVNPDHCIKSIVSVSKAESSIFKRCSKNNCFGIMYKWNLRWYDSVESNIKHRVSIYRKYRHTNKNWKDRLTRSKYCVSECKSRVSNFNSVYDII